MTRMDGLPVIHYDFTLVLTHSSVHSLTPQISLHSKYYIYAYQKAELATKELAACKQIAHLI